MKRFFKRTIAVLVLLLAGFLIWLAFTFTAATIDVRAYPAETFAEGTRPSATLPDVKLSLIECGKVMSRQAFVYRGGSWSAAYVSGMAAALVSHPKGMFLFHTGFGEHVDEHVKFIPALMKPLTTYDREASAASQLKANGIDPHQIKMVILSHSHWDHISGLDDFPEAEAWFSREEAEYIQTLPATELITHLRDRLKIHSFEISGGRYEDFDRSLDLFGDGTIVLVPLPGHTPGSIGMFVNLRSGKRFFFTGDLTWAAEGIELPAERPWISRRLVDRDDEQVRRSIVKVHQLAKRYPELVIVPAHDRRVHDRIAAFPDAER